MSARLRTPRFLSRPECSCGAGLAAPRQPRPTPCSCEAPVPKTLPSRGQGRAPPREHRLPLPRAERHLRGGDLHVVPAPGQVLLQALQGGQAQLPLQLPAVPLLGGQHLTQGDNLFFYLQKHVLT